MTCIIWLITQNEKKTNEKRHHWSTILGSISCHIMSSLVEMKSFHYECFTVLGSPCFIILCKAHWDQISVVRPNKCDVMCVPLYSEIKTSFHILKHPLVTVASTIYWGISSGKTILKRKEFSCFCFLFACKRASPFLRIVC